MNDFKTSWIRRTSKNHKAPDANEILRRDGPDALRQAFDQNRRIYVVGNHGAPKPISQQDWRSKIIAASDLQTMKFEPVRYILPGYIPEGATILAGKPKVGKSWLSLDVALGATADRFTLGTLKPAQGDVLYLALEDNRRRLQKRMNKLWPSEPAQWPQRLNLVTEWARADQGGLEDIEKWCISAKSPVLVIVDTLEKFRPLRSGKAEAYSTDYAAVAGLQKIAGKFGVAILIAHHLRKMDADDAFDTVSGTLGLTAFSSSP
jgi:RecA-family ATPase